MANAGIQYETIGPNRSVDGSAVPALDNYYEGASQAFVAGAFLIDDGAGNLIEALTTVTSVTLSNNGTLYTSAPTVTATLRGALISGTVTAGGSNYLVVPALTFSGSGGGAATAIIGGGKVVGMVVTTPATTGYTAVPTVTITAGTNPDGTTGSGAAITAVLSGITGAVAPTFTARVNGGVATTTVTAAGTGYTSIPGVDFSAPDLAGGTLASGHVTLSTTTVGAVVIDDPGSGYSTAPTITIAGGGGTGATATCTISGPLYDVQVLTAGSGIVVPPTIAFTGGAGSGAVGTTNQTLALASVIAIADGDAHNDAVAATSRILAHTLRGYRDELSGTYATTSLVRSTDTFKEVGIKRDPLTKRHYLGTSGTGAVIDGGFNVGGADASDGDSYPVVNFHLRGTLIKLA